MDTMKSYLKQFESNIQDLDIKYVREMLDILEDEILRREKAWRDEGLCEYCGGKIVQDYECNDSTGYNTVNHSYCVRCGF